MTHESIDVRVARIEEKLDNIVGMQERDMNDLRLMFLKTQETCAKICDGHGRRINDLEMWRNRIVGAYGLALAYIGWRHKL